MPTEDSIPFGFCQCGCGNLAPLVTMTCARYGRIKGQPMKFIRNHNKLLNGKPKVQWLTEQIRQHNSDECLVWPFCTDNGYGQLSYNGRLVLAHRLAFYLTHGHWPIPQACHSCDNPSCFNPRHIFAGTNLDNVEDASRKFRMGKKLTPELVTAIRRDYVPRKIGRLVLAKKYNVHQDTIWKIVTRRTWKYAP